MSYTFRDWGASATLEEVRHCLWTWMGSGDEHCFESKALALFRWQARHNATYGAFVEAMSVNPNDINRVEDIPFMPIEFFKSHEIKSGSWSTSHVFRSSGTSATTSRAQHLLDDQGLEWYAKVARLAWKVQWGQRVERWSWLGLLPGYLGREDASLLTMVSDFMTASEGSNEGMLMNDHSALNAALTNWAIAPSARPMMMFGVTWAILDWINGLAGQKDWIDSIPWHQITLLETGGMKGRGVEPIRSEVHARIRQALPDIRLASEYGMTEMMSQGYAKDGIHHGFPCWVRPIVRESRDPRSQGLLDRSGRLDVVDLGNVHSCAFLATGDVAQMTNQGLVILGRQDHAGVRGCSLLATP